MSELPRMEAMELVQQPKAFSHEDWFYEIKYDGFRGLAYVEQGVCQLVSRNDFDYSRFKDQKRTFKTGQFTDAYDSGASLKIQRTIQSTARGDPIPIPAYFLELHFLYFLSTAVPDVGELTLLLRRRCR